MAKCSSNDLATVFLHSTPTDAGINLNAASGVALPAATRLPLLAWFWRDGGVTAVGVSIRGIVGIRIARTATEDEHAPELHTGVAAADRPVPARAGGAVRGTFAATIFLTDIAFIVAMACLTGIAYHLFAYGKPGNIPLFLQVGVVAASIFAVSNLFRSEYRLPNFCTFKPHAWRTIQLWNVTLICLLMVGFLAQTTVEYSRAWIMLFYVTTLGGLLVLRYFIVRVTALARSAGFISAQRIFLIGTGAHVNAFINRYTPWAHGINIVGCRFLTPVAATASAEARHVLDRDFAEAVASVRSLEPDAIFLLLPWSQTETIERCAETFMTLPVEIHIGPSRSCTSSKR